MKKQVFSLLIGIFLLVATGKAQDAAMLYNEGLKFKEQKKIPEAVDKFKKAVALDANYYAALYEIGWCMNDLKDYTGAVSSLRKARVGWSSIPKVHFELGWAFEKLLLIDSARSSYLRCLQLKSDYSLAWKQLGTLHYNRDEHEKAVEHFNRYEQVAKDSIRDYLYFYRKGFCYNALKKYDSALYTLKHSLRFKSNYTNTWLELGFASSRLKMSEDAINYYKMAIKFEPESHVAYNGIGEVYRDYKKDMNEAMNWYRKSLELKPKERKASFGMGYCLNSQEKYTEAIPYLRTAIEQEDTYTAAYVELGYSLYKTQSYTEAEEKLLKGISLNPKNENGRYYLVLLYITQKNRTKAQKMVDELKGLSSKYVTELQNKVNAM